MSLKLGFLGTGWIGRNRLEALAKENLIASCVIHDAAEAMALAAARAAPHATIVSSFNQMLDAGLDGIVIATPSAQHAEQTRMALERGLAVFCQKPLGRDALEVNRVLKAAHSADRLLHADFSYRFTQGLRQIREIIGHGEIGPVYSVNMTFHNAYGPDKAWFYERRLSGGGCVMDLGVHLVDLALWILGFPKVVNVNSRLYTKGAPATADDIEDFASARLDLQGGTSLNLQCSWRLPIGCDCQIEAAFHGRNGGLAFRNVNGSFYDFQTELYRGTQRQILSSPPEDWSGGAIVHWARRLQTSSQFDREAWHYLDVARALDAIYARSP